MRSGKVANERVPPPTTTKERGTILSLAICLIRNTEYNNSTQLKYVEHKDTANTREI